MRAAERPSGRRLRAALAATLAAATVASVAATADAAVLRSVYPPPPEQRALTDGLHGWEGSATYGGLCIPSLTCPVIDNHFSATGGTTGDGHLQTGLGSVLGLLSVSTAIWSGPPFDYLGAEGAAPGLVAFAMRRRADVLALLDLAGNTATQRVEIVDAETGTVVARPLNGVPITPSSAWSDIGPVTVPSAALAVGRRYRLRVVSQFATNLAVGAGAAVDLDDITLVAARTTTSTAPPPPATTTATGTATPAPAAAATPAPAGGTVRPPATITPDALRHAVIVVRVGRTARGVRVVLGCAAALAGGCRVRAAAHARAGGMRLTRRREVRIAPGGRVAVTLRAIARLNGRRFVTVGLMTRSAVATVAAVRSWRRVALVP